MSQPPLSAIILAAGEGTRMRSSRPKPLHLLCGRPMLRYMLDALGETDVGTVVVVIGRGAEQVSKKLTEQGSEPAVELVEQKVARGTGDAVSVGLTGLPEEELDADGDVLVLPGDHPLLRPATIASLVERHRAEDAACTVLTVRMQDPGGYGRVVRDPAGRVARIVEQADASDEELDIDEVNTSIYCFRLSLLAPALRRLSPENAQGEYYLTDVVAVLADAGYTVAGVLAPDERETQGVNDRQQLAAAEAELRRRTNASWMVRGVTMLDPQRTYIDATVELAPDVTLFPGTLLQGGCRVGAGAEIGPDTRLVDCEVGEGAVVEVSIGRQASIGARSRVGPFAVLEPGAEVPADVRTGPFYTADGSSA